MPKRSVERAYVLFAFAMLLAAVAIVGTIAAGVDRQTALSTYLITNTAIGLSAAPCGLVIARAKPSNPIGWLFLIAGIAPLLTAAMVPAMVYGGTNGWPTGAMRLIVTVSMFSWSRGGRSPKQRPVRCLR